MCARARVRLATTLRKVTRLSDGGGSNLGDVTMRAWTKVLATALASAAVLAAGVAQSQEQRPLARGSFASVELAFPPKDAARQVELMQTALAGLAPQRPGTPDVYVLSLSLWDDNVFEKEASETAAVLARRFKAEGRTMVLSAGVKGQERTLPAATPMFFAAALGRLATIMDPAEDVLVLFMTSHGNRSGTIGFYEERRMRAEMSGRQLRAMLDQTGLPNRLIIVSACFSGAFIAPLASETTIIFTAASSTQTSFGCQPERDWTYFGDAFVNQQLRSATPLMTAFEQAKTTIAGWEKRDGYEPSNPQRSVGARTEAILRALGER